MVEAPLFCPEGKHAVCATLARLEAQLRYDREAEAEAHRRAEAAKAALEEARSQEALFHQRAVVEARVIEELEEIA